jgi:cytochrome c biogenesis protein CcmG/thiol:disulfide interchange protein DsbE
MSRTSTGMIMIVTLALTGFIRQGRVPDFSLINIDNERVSYSEMKGEQLTVIDFWATWCQPCIRSIPELVDMYSAYGEKGVGFIGISVDSPRNLSKVKPFSRSLGITYPVLLDSNSEVMGELNVTAVPTLLIIDREDRILYRHEGFRPGDEQLIREELERHLNGTGQ